MTSSAPRVQAGRDASVSTFVDTNMRSMVTVDPALLLRAIEVYEDDHLDIAEAYLIAYAESTGIGRVASFDRAIDRVDTLERIEP